MRNYEGIRISKNILKFINLNTNDKVDLNCENKIVTAKPKKHLTIEERIKMYESLPEEEKGSVDDYDWGEPTGKEI